MPQYVTMDTNGHQEILRLFFSACGVGWRV